MKVAKVSIIAAAVLAVATLANAQNKPDFSGTWVPDPATEAGGGGGGMGAVKQTVKQTADTLSVERIVGENKVSLTYKLDGSETKNQVMAGRGSNTVEAISTAKWEGATLVMSMKRPGPDGAIQEAIEKWSLAGDTLTIERTGPGAGKRTFKKGT